TGVIEGACRHLVADRMDITGARWGLDRAEAILKLRAITTNGDFDAYWAYHLQQERQRVHHTRYLGGVVPTQNHSPQGSRTLCHERGEELNSRRKILDAVLYER